MAANQHDNLKNYKRINNFVLFKADNKDIGYDKLSISTVNHEKGDFDDFVKCIKNIILYNKQKKELIYFFFALFLYLCYNTTPVEGMFIWMHMKDIIVDHIML